MLELKWNLSIKFIKVGDNSGKMSLRFASLTLYLKYWRYIEIWNFAFIFGTQKFKYFNLHYKKHGYIFGAKNSNSKCNFAPTKFIFEVHHSKGGNFHQVHCFCWCRLSKNDCFSFVRSIRVWEIAGCEIVRLNIQELQFTRWERCLMWQVNNWGNYVCHSQNPATRHASHDENWK